MINVKGCSVRKSLMAAAVLAVLPFPAFADPVQSWTTSNATTPDVVTTLDDPAPRTPSLDLAVTSGGSWSSGKYGGSSDTDIITVPIAVSLEHAGWRLTANEPWMRIRTAGAVFAGIDGQPIVWSPGGRGPKHTSSGLGDLTLGLAYSVPNLPNGWEFEIVGKAKLPTSRFSRGLSTGEHDYEVGATVAKDGPVTPFVTVNYRWFGDPQSIDLRDGFSIQGGGSAKVGPGTARLSYAWARSPSPYVHNSNEIVAAYAVPVSRFTLSAFGSAGLTNGAPDKAVGLILSFRI